MLLEKFNEIINCCCVTLIHLLRLISKKNQQKSTCPFKCLTMERDPLTFYMMICLPSELLTFLHVFHPSALWWHKLLSRSETLRGPCPMLFAQAEMPFEHSSFCWLGASRGWGEMDTTPESPGNTSRSSWMGTCLEHLLVPLQATSCSWDFCFKGSETLP